MFKKLILSTLLPLTLFSYELNFSKKFSTQISPDILNSYINVTVQNKDERYINDNIELFNDYLKDNDEIIKQNGSYTLTPKYKYINNKQKFLGYMGILNYSITSSTAIVMNEFIKETMELKGKIASKNITVRISNLSWKISDKLYNDNLDNLRLLAINWIELYSKNLNRQCIIKSIKIEGKDNNRPRGISLMSKSLSNITPLQVQKEITINPNYTLECK
ncbi:MAG: SIMPL domain-containing protein [Arcobacteraceae bacterium]|nr:SIMPL domain-containing protein [Arcobacteraceae bacterium]